MTLVDFLNAFRNAHGMAYMLKDVTCIRTAGFCVEAVEHTD